MQELARGVRKETKDAIKKDVNFGVIRYTNFHGERQECRNVDRLLATIVKFGFKEKEEKIQEQKDVSEQKKYAATISRQNLQSEIIPTLFMTPMKNNLAIYIRCIWSKFRLVGSNDPASMFNLIYTVKKTAGPLSTQIGQYRKFTDILKHISIYYLQGNQGIQTLFNIRSMEPSSALDTGQALANIELFLETASLALDLTMVAHIQATDVSQMVDYIFLSPAIKD